MLGKIRTSYIENTITVVRDIPDFARLDDMIAGFSQAQRMVFNPYLQGRATYKELTGLSPKKTHRKCQMKLITGL
jgi:hypothetical protein